jgi:peptidoglycan/xylan/chitin deacetylase (PgdA/CDA1 family)
MIRSHARLARFAMLAAAPVLFGLAGCAQGSPSLTPDKTATARAAAQTQAAIPTSTATPSPTAISTNTPVAPTSIPEPSAAPTLAATATPRATARPDAPPDDGTGLSQIVDHADSGRPEIALTFDAGADRGNAEKILDILDDAGIKGSFGMTGAWAQANPDLVRRIVNEGHMVFNHTWDHRSFTGYSTAGSDDGVLDSADRIKEIKDTEQEILDLTGYDTAPYFRPPYGDYDDSVLADVESAGYSITVMWSCDTLGWNGATVEQILDRCGANASAGDIILMHVGADSADADSLPQMIQTLQDQGFTLVTVDQLLAPST